MLNTHKDFYMSDEKLESLLIEHEGIKKYAYLDSKGYLTIGIGFCIDEKLKCGLSIDECMMILRSRIRALKKELSRYDWYNKQDDVRKEVVIELAYNMGIPKLLDFKKFIAAMDDRQVVLAAKELVNSLWYEQVGKSRSNSILTRLRSGRYV